MAVLTFVGGEVQQLEIDRLISSTRNPRDTRRVDPVALGELAESIAELGIIQPLLVRAAGAGFEILCGHRRAAAARQLGLASVPCLVTDAEDQVALEAALVENLQRTDLHPIEEAAAYRELAAMGMSASAIAARVGRSETLVRRRLRLQQLPPKIAARVREAGIDVTVAEQLARVPAELLDAALDTVEKEGRWRDAEGIIQILDREYMRRLDRAPFKLDDAELCPDAGACTTCPKRSGNQPELFAARSDDSCTDPPCYDRKLRALFERVCAEHPDAKVLEGAAARKVVQRAWIPYSAPYVSLDGHLPFSAGSQKKWRTFLGKKAVEVTAIALCPDTGVAVQLMDKKRAFAAAKEKGAKWASPAAAAGKGGGVTPARKRELAQQRIRREAAREALIDIETAVMQEMVAREDLVHLLTWVLLDQIGPTGRVQVAERVFEPDAFAAYKKGAERYDRVHEKSKILEACQPRPDETSSSAMGRLIRLALGVAAVDAYEYRAHSALLRKACEAASVDLEAIEKGLAEEAALAKATPKKPAKGKAKRRSKAPRPASAAA